MYYFCKASMPMKIRLPKFIWISSTNALVDEQKHAIVSAKDWSDTKKEIGVNGKINNFRLRYVLLLYSNFVSSKPHLKPMLYLHLTSCMTIIYFIQLLYSSVLLLGIRYKSSLLYSYFLGLPYLSIVLKLFIHKVK